jgi:hypothetical protein
MEVKLLLVDELASQTYNTDDGRVRQSKEYRRHDGLRHTLLRSIPECDVSNSGPDDEVGQIFTEGLDRFQRR